MVFNPSKTVSLTINNISKNHDNQPLMLENTIVSEVGEHTHLGVTFSRNIPGRLTSIICAKKPGSNWV